MRLMVRKEYLTMSLTIRKLSRYYEKRVVEIEEQRNGWNTATRGLFYEISRGVFEFGRETALTTVGYYGNFITNKILSAL